MTGVPSWLTDMNNSIQGIVDYVTNNNYLEYAVSSGFGDVPIAAYGMVVIVLSTFAYATAADPNNITSLSNTAYNMVKSVPGLSNSDLTEVKKQFDEDDKEQMAKNDAEYKALMEQEEKEEQEKEKLLEEANDEEESNSKKKDEDEDEEMFKGGKGTLRNPLSNKRKKRITKKTYRKRK